MGDIGCEVGLGLVHLVSSRQSHYTLLCSANRCIGDIYLAHDILLGKDVVIKLESVNVRIPATSYLVPLFTLIYLVLFHLLLPSYLDVPCYLNNRQRYCSVWPERDWTPYTTCLSPMSHIFV